MNPSPPALWMPSFGWLFRVVVGLAVSGNHAAAATAAEIAQAWSVAEQRCEATVAWIESEYGESGMYDCYPTVGNLATGRWSTASHTKDWRAGFWPGTLWFLAQRTGSAFWRQRAMDWSDPLVASENIDHDIGFILLGSLGKARAFHDDLNDPGGAYRAFAAAAITTAATKLDSRFNMPNPSGIPVPAGFTRSWDSWFPRPYPVCVDNLMNLEVMFLAYELNGRLPQQRVWFDHALTHARTSIARHLRPDGSTYHVVCHFDGGTRIGQIERKTTHQGYGDETTWSRGQAWAIYGFSAAYRHARRDPGTDASDVLAAARTAADYFIDHLPHHRSADPYNHRPNDFVPPSDFDASLGEPIGPWNDANNDYNSATGTGLGDRKPATNAFTLRDSSAAAIAASGLIELSGYVPDAMDRARYLGAAEDILHCLITYDGPDPDTEPDYLCQPGEAAHPGILKAGSVKWGDPNQSVIYGDYYFLEALARFEALQARETLANTQRMDLSGGVPHFEFETRDPAPALTFRVQRSPDLAPGSWETVAARTGTGPWSGSATLSEQTLQEGRVRMMINDPTPASRGFFRIVTRSVGGGGP